MAQDSDIRLLTSPRIFLVGMAAFLALVGFVVLILYQQIAIAFRADPGLNSLILGVLTIGARLDEGGELSRYLVGLLVFLGLLGTFWGLLETVHSIAGVIDSMKTGVDTASMFDALKTGLSAPISGMSVSFTSSLFGLASSLVLGFLDLQAGQAQNRFYSEFEEFLASHVQTTPAVEAVPDAPIIGQGAQPVIEYQRDAKAIATLAEGIQALVGHMRTEQQQIRDWVDAQATQQEDIGKLLRRLLDELGAR